MRNRPRVAVMPIGTVSSPEVNRDLRRIKHEIASAEFEPIFLSPEIHELEVIRTAEAARKTDPDLLLLVPLHGGSAQQQVLAAETCKTFTVIWSLPRRFSMPSGAIAYGALVERGTIVKYVYGNPGLQVIAKLEDYARVAYAINRLRTSRIGVIGRVLPNMVASEYDVNVIRSNLGPHVTTVEIADLQDTLRKVREGDLDRAISGLDNFRLKASAPRIRDAMRVHLAVKKITEERKLDAMAMECWTEILRLFQVTPCMGYVEDAYAIGCEGDVVGAALLLMIEYLTDKPAVMLDVFSLTGSILKMSGMCSAPASISKVSDVTICEMAIPPMFNIKQRVVAVRPAIKWKTVTLLRISGKNVNKLHLVHGRILGVDREHYVEIKIKLTGKVDHFIENLHGHLYAVVPGDISDRVKLFCEWAGLRLVET